MRIPSFLNDGDTIGIVSVGNRVAFPIEQIILEIEGFGYRVKRGKTLDSSYNQLSGTDSERIADLQDMLDDSDVKCILFACGGYGAVRVIDHLNFNRFMEEPKWLAGYSDVTALQILLKEKLGLASIHSFMPVDFRESNDESLRSLMDVLKGKNIEYEIEPNPKNRLGEMNGVISGGNLSLVYSLMGSPTALNPDDTILFIEDIGEKLYHIDRMMMNIKRAGKLKGLKGLICGAFNSMKDNDIPFGKNAEEIILEHCAEYSFPVLLNFPAGHIKVNKAFILGAESSVHISKESVKFRQILKSEI